MTGSVDARVAQIAAAISEARSRGRCLRAPFEGSPIDPAQAYAIQRLVIAERFARGEVPVGWKLGYTSAVMREQMGIAEPNFGPLTDAMLLTSGACVPASVMQPRVEPEIALVIASDVRGSVDPDSVRAHVKRAHAALEVVDSVWSDYRFGWADNTADGSSAAFVVIGPELAMDALESMPVELRRNGAVVGRGRGSDAMGSPFASLAWLSEQLRGRGRSLMAGDVVITGGLTAAVPLERGDTIEAVVGSGSVLVTR